jgi:hypothetical protein
MTTNDTAIHTRALLVWLQISTWSARKYDRSVSNRVNRDAGASDDAGRYNKFLLPGDAPSYKALVTLMSSIRAWHYNETLAWSDEGWRLLPTANYMRYTDGLRKHQADTDRAVNAFVADYPALRTQAAIKLNGLYKSDDYPDVCDIRSKFAIGLNYMPVPAAGDIRVDLAADQIGAIESEIQSKAASSINTAMSDAWQRLHSVVAAVAGKLADPTAIFRDSLIGNASELCEVLKRLNVTNDPDLESMRVTVQSQIASCLPQDLRDSKRTRQQTADKANAILSSMAAFYTPAA